ncbi:hypothetical protein BC567DRAFT_227390 [Phyllosticta citribraziliensis]
MSQTQPPIRTKFVDKYMYSWRAWSDSCQYIVAVGKDMDDAFARDFCLEACGVAREVKCGAGRFREEEGAC